MSSLDSFLEFEKRREKLRSPLLDEAENAFDDPGINFKGDSGITKQMESMGMCVYAFEGNLVHVLCVDGPAPINREEI